MSSIKSSKSNSKNNSSNRANKLIQCKRCLIILLPKNNSPNEPNQHECFNLNLLKEENSFFLFQDLFALNSIEHSKGKI